ncbi:hypothetical protein AWW67_13880 [Roseivirga seohaensis]|uniref:Methyltransferase small domain-containing protein n=1 Tax=Roseivirga seohaensis TaxID=1914963 RepID=A0A150XL91_9BACT|nr:methyltransferase [Roseivirga seohaensis]KYG79454.1 hypothetical protein AWW67_13880 [Roseivirga seohaensis]
MNVIARKLKSLLFKPLSYAYRKYSRKERTTRVAGIKLTVLPGVFNPRLFFSTKFMMRYIEQYHLQDKHVLDVGSGSGALAIAAAVKGAKVVAIDINQLAVDNTVKNALLNKLDLQVLRSDLWKDLPLQTFDMVLVNPPYYPKSPTNKEELAWYCGDNFQYFDCFFNGLGSFIHSKTKVIMILSEDCEIESIGSIAEKNSFEMVLAKRKRVCWEINYIFYIRQKSHG